MIGHVTNILSHSHLDVPILAPVVSPGILDYPVLVVRVGLVVANNQDCMIWFAIVDALQVIIDSVTVVPEGFAGSHPY